jgi:hypothetical protein
MMESLQTFRHGQVFRIVGPPFAPSAKKQNCALRKESGTIVIVRLKKPNRKEAVNLNEKGWATRYISPVSRRTATGA